MISQQLRLRVTHYLADVVLWMALPYCWYRAVEVFLGVGRVASHWTLGVAICCGFLGWASWFLRRRGHATETIPLGAMLVGGFALHLMFWEWLASELNTSFSVAVVYALASLWPWVGWWVMQTPGSRRRAILVTSAALAVMLIGLGLLERVGLDGDGRPIVRLRLADGEARAAAIPRGVTPPAEATALAATGPIGPNDFAEFRGPRRVASLPARALPSDWPSGPVRVLWRRAVGPAWSGMAVAGDAVFTQEQRVAEKDGEQGEEQKGMQLVTCYRLSDGTPLWQHADPGIFSSSIGGDGPRATPTVTEDRVYALGPTGLLSCLERATGQLIWQADIIRDAAAEVPAHGMCGSPLVLDELVVDGLPLDGLVVASAGGTAGKSLLAYDRTRGELRWSGGNDAAGYGSPQLVTLAGVPQIVIVNATQVTAHDPRTGQVLWSVPFGDQGKANCSQAVPLPDEPNRLLLTAGYGLGSMLVEVTPGEPWQVATVWESHELKTKFTSAVIHNGFAYALDDALLECVDLASGERQWKKGRFGHGQVLLTGDVLVMQSEAGPVHFVAADPQKFRELGMLEALQNKTWNNPTLAGNLLLVRNDQEMICFELGQPAATPGP